MGKDNLNKVKISIVFNILIVLLTIFTTIMMFTGFKFMPGDDLVLESTNISMFRFFTVDSNVFMGLVALIFSILEIKLLTGKIEQIPKKYYILKLMGTTGVALTFFVVVTYLAPVIPNGFVLLFKNSNLFYHLVTPLLSIFTFIFFEKTDALSFKNSFYGIVPTFLYEIFYIVNILVHMENGKVSYIYDWYMFVQNGVWTAIIVAPLMLVITYVLSLIIWKLNRIKAYQ